MNTAERFDAMAEVEGAVEWLVECGWVVESIQYDDTNGEPFRVQVTLATDGRDENEGVL